MAYIDSVKYVPDYDEQFLDASFVEEYPNNMRLCTLSYKGQFLVSSRDFSYVDQYVFQPDGTINSAQTSVVDPRTAPTGKHVRGRIMVL